MAMKLQTSAGNAVFRAAVRGPTDRITRRIVAGFVSVVCLVFCESASAQCTITSEQPGSVHTRPA
jgi:hypothetical protein